MNDIKNITGAILAGASEECKAIEKEAAQKADAEAEKILEKARAQADTILQEAEKTAAEQIRREKSATALNERNALMFFKTNAVDSVLDEAIQAVNALEKDRYLAYLTGYFGAVCENRNGALLLNDRDKAGLGGDFLKKAREILAAKHPGAEIALGETAAPISGGFILKYDDMEINCSTVSLAGMKKREIEKELYAMLFA